MPNIFTDENGKVVLWKIGIVAFAFIVVLVIILAALGVFSSNDNSIINKKKPKGEPKAELPRFTWHQRGWIDNPYTNFIPADSRNVCETSCLNEPNNKCKAYAYHNNIKGCYYYDKTQPDTPAGIRTDIDYGNTYPWGVGIRNY